MSGHSKWSTIKRQKGAADAKRGALFTKLANAITVAVRETGEKNPDINFKLRLAVERARSANMPNENIERAIKRGSGELNDQAIESVTYEGLGPAGTALIIEVLTDNKNRTAGEIRSILAKYGGRLVGPNSVMWQFSQKGLITINLDNNKKSQEEIEALAIEAGADDVKINKDELELVIPADGLKQAQDLLNNNGVTLASSELAYLPNNFEMLSDNKKTQLEKLINELEDNQAVVSIYDNIK